jgi:hypothetical protein
MRIVAAFFALVVIALTVAGCDPVTERRYFTEGAGVDLYTSDREAQVELKNQYIKFVCEQAGPDCGGSWTTFVQAGMNDIDLRCDGFLTWLDARRRDREPVLSEISILNTTQARSWRQPAPVRNRFRSRLRRSGWLPLLTPTGIDSLNALGVRDAARPQPVA